MVRVTRRGGGQAEKITAGRQASDSDAPRRRARARQASRLRTGCRRQSGAAAAAGSGSVCGCEAQLLHELVVVGVRLELVLLLVVRGALNEHPLLVGVGRSMSV
eukprot:3184748-Heterocapsa_arctica.AAC.1